MRVPGLGHNVVQLDSLLHGAWHAATPAVAEELLVGGSMDGYPDLLAALGVNVLWVFDHSQCADILDGFCCAFLEAIGVDLIRFDNTKAPHSNTL